MIHNDAQLAVVRQQLALAKHALAALRCEVEPKNKRNFEILAEGPIDQITALKAEIDAYEASKKTPKASHKNGKGRGRRAS